MVTLTSEITQSDTSQMMVQDSSHVARSAEIIIRFFLCVITDTVQLQLRNYQEKEGERRTAGVL